MNLTELNKHIEQKTAKLAVIGLGYVGLPVACEFARRGFDVLGVELLSERVDKINAGHSPIAGVEPGMSALLAEVIDKQKLRATTDYQELRDRHVILIDVETPVDEDHTPGYEALKTVLRELGPVIKQGALVIVESTVAPGTMTGLVAPLLEKYIGKSVNEGFYLGNCPERVMPGKLLANLRTLSRVVGGMTVETAQTMISLYRHIIDADLDPTDCVTAELVKTVENTYRDVQIAFANEIALICEAVGADAWEVRQLVNKSPGRIMLNPGAGVGGHCIPKDPWLLAYGVKGKNVPLRIIPAAREINEGMPDHVLRLLHSAFAEAGLQLEKSRVLVLGYAYLEESGDTRNSPSEVLVGRLRTLGAEVEIHDPYVPAYQGDLYQLAQGCNAVILMVRHNAYLNIDLHRLKTWLSTPVLIDSRHMLNFIKFREAGFIYRGVGIGENY
jgi:UDP-N-acetyl-D-mannosaminuronic acid dehydrogenase